MDNAKIQVRFSDCDMMGHVNNAVYLSYFESARIYYLNQLLGKDWNWKKNGIILLKNIIEYKKPVFLEDKVEIQVRTKHIGNKSFSLSYTLFANKKEKTTGESVLVCFDFDKNQTTEIPVLLQKALEKLK
jgi:acyl-CoA thioester hydrolase